MLGCEQCDTTFVSCTKFLPYRQLLIFRDLFSFRTAPATHSGFAHDPDTVPTFAQNEPGLPLKITAADFPTSPVRPYTKDYFS